MAWPMWLSGVDIVLLYSALVTIAVLVCLWVYRHRPSLFSLAPDRQNSLREDAVIFPILAYGCTFLLLVSLFSVETDGAPSATSVWVGACSQAAGAAVCLWMAAKFVVGGNRRFWLGPPIRGRRPWLAQWVLLGTLVATGLCPLILHFTLVVFEYIAPGRELPVHSTLRLLRQLEQPSGVVGALWISAAIVAPLAEELFFRGMIQTAVLNVTRNRAWAIGVATAAFAFAHTQQFHAVPALAFLSFILGYVYERTGSLLAPFLIHSLFNLKTLVWDTVARSGS